MLQITLAPQRPVKDDPLGRHTVGWAPEMSQEDAWLAGRGVWKLNADSVLSQQEAQIVNPEGIVVAVATITGVEKHDDRRAVLGDLLRDDPRVGRPAPSPSRSRNPISYV